MLAGVWETKVDWETGEVSPAPSEKLVEAALDITEWLYTALNRYLGRRHEMDSSWRIWRGDRDGDDEATIDWYGDTINIQWKEAGRCGDTDYYHREFPKRHLWEPWGQVKKEIESGGV